MTEQQKRYVDAFKTVFCRKADGPLEPGIAEVRDAFKADEWIPPICRKLGELDNKHAILVFAATCFVAGMQYAKGEGWIGE